MVEVFKTNVNDWDQARMLLERIHLTFWEYEANFDLEDCDRILRVTCINGDVQSFLLIKLFKHWGFHAEILPDTIYVAEQHFRHTRKVLVRTEIND